VPKFNISGDRIALYCFIMPSSSIRFVFAKTVVIGELIFWRFETLSWLRLQAILCLVLLLRRVPKH
jgi:hypothetical protein